MHGATHIKISRVFQGLCSLMYYKKKHTSSVLQKHKILSKFIDMEYKIFILLPYQ